MLTLSRKLNEQIVIGEGESQIIVQVTAILGNRVRLGITAARSIPVRRAELEPREPRAGGVEEEAA